MGKWRSNDWMAGSKQPRRFCHSNKSLLVLAQHERPRNWFCERSYEENKVKSSCDSQGLNISINCAFKVALCVQWEEWLTSEEKPFTKTGRMRKAKYASGSWQRGAQSRKSLSGSERLNWLRVVEGSTGLAKNLPENEDSDNDNDPRKTWSDEAILRLLTSDTEGGRQWLMTFLVSHCFVTSRVPALLSLKPA